MRVGAGRRGPQVTPTPLPQDQPPNLSIAVPSGSPLSGRTQLGSAPEASWDLPLETPWKTRAGGPLRSLGSGLDVMGGPRAAQRWEGLRPDSHGAPGPARRTPRGWQAVSLSMSLPAAPQSRRVSHTASSMDRGPGWPEVPTLSSWSRWAVGGSAVPAGAPACAPASRTGCGLVPQQGSQASFCPAPAGDTAPEASDQGQRSPSRQGSHSCHEQSLAVPHSPAGGVRRPRARGRGHGGAPPVRSQPITAGLAWRLRG